MTIICFFGPDGSGKTSLAQRTAQTLAENGLRVRYSWMRGSHTLASVLARLLSKVDRFKGDDNPYYRISIPANLVWLWQWVECVSVAPVIFLRYILPQLLGFTIAADRYVLDFLVWVAVTTDDEGFLKGFRARCGIYLATKSTILFYVTAEPEKLAARKGMNRDFLIRQIDMYNTIIDTFSLKVHGIETTESTLEDSLNTVINVIGGTQ